MSEPRTGDEFFESAAKVAEELIQQKLRKELFESAQLFLTVLTTRCAEMSAPRETRLLRDVVEVAYLKLLEETKL